MIYCTGKRRGDAALKKSEENVMHYSKDIENMICVAKGVSGRFEHGPAPIPEEGLWVKAKEIKDIKGLTHGIGWCAQIGRAHV